jgi:hypothetical protein
MDAAPGGRAGLWQALTTAAASVPEASPPPDVSGGTGGEAPHLGYLARVRGGMAGHPAAGHPSRHPGRRKGPRARDGDAGAAVVDLVAYRARRGGRPG